MAEEPHATTKRTLTVQDIHADAEMFTFDEDMPNSSLETDECVYRGSAFRHLFMQYRQLQHEHASDGGLTQRMPTQMEHSAESGRDDIDELLAKLPAECMARLAPLPDEFDDGAWERLTPQGPQLDESVAPPIPHRPHTAAPPSRRPSTTAPFSAVAGAPTTTTTVDGKSLSPCPPSRSARMCRRRAYSPRLPSLIEEHIQEEAWPVSQTMAEKSAIKEQEEVFCFAHVPHQVRTIAFLQQGKAERVTRLALRGARPRTTLADLKNFLRRSPDAVHSLDLAVDVSLSDLSLSEWAKRARLH